MLLFMDIEVETGGAVFGVRLYCILLKDVVVLLPYSIT